MSFRDVQPLKEIEKKLRKIDFEAQSRCGDRKKMRREEQLNNEVDSPLHCGELMRAGGVGYL